MCRWGGAVCSSNLHTCHMPCCSARLSALCLVLACLLPLLPLAPRQFCPRCHTACLPATLPLPCCSFLPGCHQARRITGACGGSWHTQLPARQSSLPQELWGRQRCTSSACPACRFVHLPCFIPIPPCSVASSRSASQAACVWLCEAPLAGTVPSESSRKPMGSALPVQVQPYRGPAKARLGVLARTPPIHHIYRCNSPCGPVASTFARHRSALPPQ